MDSTVGKGRRFFLILALVWMLPWSQLGAYCLQGIEVGATPYFKAGALAWDQEDAIGGHKFMTAYGLRSNIDWDCFEVGVNIEGWVVTESMGDDEGYIPDCGWHIYSDLSYFTQNRAWTVYPFARLGYESWDRGRNATDWNDLSFIYGGIGAGVEGRDCYFSIACTYPFGVSSGQGTSPSSRPGFNSEMGILYECIQVGMFIDYKGFENPDAKMLQTGLVVGYRLS